MSSKYGYYTVVSSIYPNTMSLRASTLPHVVRQTDVTGITDVANLTDLLFLKLLSQ